MKNTPDQIIELQVTGIKCYQKGDHLNIWDLGQPSIDAFKGVVRDFYPYTIHKFTLLREFNAVLKDRHGNCVLKLNANKILHKRGITYTTLFTCRELRPMSYYITDANLGANGPLDIYLDNKYNSVDKTTGEIKPHSYPFVVTSKTPAFYSYKNIVMDKSDYTISDVKPIDTTKYLIVNSDTLHGLLDGQTDDIPQELKDFLTMRRVVMPATPEYINLLFGPQHS